MTPFWYHQVEHWGKTAQRSTLFPLPPQLRLGFVLEPPPTVTGPCRAVPIPQGPTPTDLDQPLPLPLRQALDRLFAPAPSHLFPRARHLYFLKYPLEGHPEELDSSPFAARFRTFMLRDTTCLPTEEMEDPRAITRVSELAVVHWQAPQTNREDYATYIRTTWQLEPHDLQMIENPWFREGGAWARLLLTRPAADPAPAPAAPGSTP